MNKRSYWRNISCVKKRIRFIALLCGISGVVAIGCGLGDSPLAEIDPEAVPEVVTFELHILPRINYYCSGCHHPDSPLGNAGGWNFSSYALVRGSFASIRNAAFVKANMPPGGARRMSARDEAIFDRWRDVGFPER